MLSGKVHVLVFYTLLKGVSCFMHFVYHHNRKKGGDGNFWWIGNSLILFFPSSLITKFLGHTSFPSLLIFLFYSTPTLFYSRPVFIYPALIYLCICIFFFYFSVPFFRCVIIVFTSVFFLPFSLISFHFEALFVKLRKATISSSSCLSARPHGTTGLPLDGFSWNFIFEYFSKFCWENSSFIKIWPE